MGDSERERFRKSVYTVLSFVFIIWFIKALEQATGADFTDFGILPRTLHGSIGIITSPLIHGDVVHLLSNTFPLVFLGVGILYFYPRIGLQVSLLIYVMTGFWVWVAARQAMHIGASGLVYGLFAFLLVGGFIRWDRRTLAISLALLFLYGSSMFSGLVPTTESISWESHLMGFFAGTFCAIYFRKEPIFQIVPTSNILKDEDRESSISSSSLEEIHFHYNYVPKKQDDDSINE